MKIKLQFLVATGLATYMDIAAGMFIIYSIAHIMNVEIYWWYLLVGSFLALLPDFDIILKGLQARLRGTWRMGDHRDTLMHKPIFMMPACVTVAYITSGSFWAITIFTCLLYHYLHDSRWFSTGDIDWLASGKKMPWMETTDWLRQYWLKPTSVSIKDLSVGSLLFIILTWWSTYTLLITIPLLTWLAAFCLWWTRGVFTK